MNKQWRSKNLNLMHIRNVVFFVSNIYIHKELKILELEEQRKIKTQDVNGYETDGYNLALNGNSTNELNCKIKIKWSWK
jgi:hypothetical protein